MEVNLIAVLLATVAAFIIGGFWYSPFLFGNAWTSAMGFNEKEMKKKGVAKSYILNFIATLIMAYVFAHILALLKVVDLLESLQAAFWIWLGFIATVGMGSVLWENKPLKLYFINVLYYLVMLVAMAAVITVFSDNSIYGAFLPSPT
ncbi:DUF1761 domain-containing protein [Candidatus Peregrinibacteria bacterium]|nr:DUF1761 domain-containing protein [Candidatus Peregrinibacteria bacterium]